MKILLLICLGMAGIVLAQERKEQEGINLSVPSTDTVRLNFKVINNILEICKESPWSEKACLRFENLPERETEHLQKWLKPPAK